MERIEYNIVDKESFSIDGQIKLTDTEAVALEAFRKGKMLIPVTIQDINNRLQADLKAISEARETIRKIKARNKLVYCYQWLNDNDLAFNQIVMVRRSREWHKGVLIGLLHEGCYIKPKVQMYNSTGDLGKRVWTWQIDEIKPA